MRRAAALALLAGLGGAWLSLPAAGPAAATGPAGPRGPAAGARPFAQAAASASPAPRSRTGSAPVPSVEVTVTDLRPRAPRPGDDLQVVGSLRNPGTEPLTGLQLRVRSGERITTRGDLRQAAATPPATRQVQVQVQTLPDLAPGARTALDVRVPVDSLRLGQDGAYPLQLEVRGTRGTGPRTQLGLVSTFLPWFGTTPLDPIRIAWAWPLVDQPRLGPDDVPTDDVLAGSLAAGGRLGRSLQAARAGESGVCPAPAEAAPGRSTPAPAPAACSPVPVTYVVDPDLLYTADILRRAGTAAAGSWLDSLRAATATSGVVALPYGDPDVVSLTRGSSPLAADVATATAYGATVTRDLLGRTPLPTVSVPPEGPLTDAAYDALTTGAQQAVVLGDDAVRPPAAGARSTPGARVALPPSSTSGAVTGLVVDRGLSDLLVPAAPQDARLAEQRWLVETAMVAAELPSRGRTLLVEPPRRGDLDPGVAGQAVADTGRVPWMCGVALAAVAAGSERCPRAAVPSYAPDRQADLAAADPGAPGLAAPLLSDVTGLRAEATQLTGAVVQPGTDQAQALRVRLQRAWLRGESSAWRDDQRDGLALVARGRADVDALRAKVSVLTAQVTLTSNNGRVEVALVNELEQPVTVALRLVAPTHARLSRAQTELLTLPPRNSLPVSVEATTLTSGRFVVKAQLLDRDGEPFGPPKDLVVRSTRYGSVALAVTGLAAAVLFVAVGVRIVRRALRHRARVTGAAS